MGSASEGTTVREAASIAAVTFGAGARDEDVRESLGREDPIGPALEVGSGRLLEAGEDVRAEVAEPRAEQALEDVPQLPTSPGGRGWKEMPLRRGRVRSRAVVGLELDLEDFWRECDDVPDGD